HDARPAAGDDGKAFLRQQPRGLLGLLVEGIVGLGPGRAEDRDRPADRGHHLEPLDELGHDAENPPTVLAVGAERLAGIVLVLTYVQCIRSCSRSWSD